MPNIRVRETDGSGRTFAIHSQDYTTIQSYQQGGSNLRLSSSWLELLRGIFLPAGYPATVSSDYLECQIYYGIQAFCSSLAGLLASRAVLEGHGIGKADASATNAMLLTVLQDAFSRFTTILGAYYLGTLLYPEAKTYRLVADIANDVAIVFDLFSPRLSNYSISWSFPYLSPQPGTALRVMALCLSGAFRALCGVAAGGSRAALTLHFAQDGIVPGDVGDLSAKDASKETVLALAGMLIGSLIIPHLYTPRSTYTVVFLLLIGHLLSNYVAVRVVVMRSLNKQRAAILWSAYRQNTEDGLPCRRVLSPKQVAGQEYLFGHEHALLNSQSRRHQIAGYATIGSSFSHILPLSSSIFTRRHPDERWKNLTWMPELLDLFADEKFIIWFDRRLYLPSTLLLPRPDRPRFHVLLKEGHTSADHLKSWAFACDLATSLEDDINGRDGSELVEEIARIKQTFDEAYKGFVDDIKRAGWEIDVPGLVSRSPRVIHIEATEVAEFEDKKTI